MGDSFIYLNEIDAAYVASQPLPELQPAKMDPVTQKIGEYVALLIEDGATLQMGIGKIPDAVLNSLHHLGKLHAAEIELPAFRLIGRLIPQNLSYFKSNSQTSCHVNGVCRV